jgi:hypothetical protein
MNTAEEKRTPTPWQFERSHSKSVHGSQCVGFIDNGDTNIADVVASYNMTDGEALANAAFIVLACNSFDALTEANAKLLARIAELEPAAECWNAIAACYRITCMGSAGLTAEYRNDRGYAHATFNLWTVRGPGPDGATGDAQDLRGRELLGEFMKVAIENLKSTGAK